MTSIDAAPVTGCSMPQPAVVAGAPSPWTVLGDTRQAGDAVMMRDGAATR
ncbi:MAG: hypothetical protein AB1586_34075 [Pseudomonadota bacterium]